MASLKDGVVITFSERALKWPRVLLEAQCGMNSQRMLHSLRLPFTARMVTILSVGATLKLGRHSISSQAWKDSASRGRFGGSAHTWCDFNGTYRNPTQAESGPSTSSG